MGSSSAQKHATEGSIQTAMLVSAVDIHQDQTVTILSVNNILGALQV